MQPAVQDIPKLLVSDVIRCLWKRAPQACPALELLGETYISSCVRLRWMSLPIGWQIGVLYKAKA